MWSYNLRLGKEARKINLCEVRLHGRLAINLAGWLRIMIGLGNACNCAWIKFTQVAWYCIVNGLVTTSQ